MNKPRDYQYFRSDELACKCHYLDCPRHGMDDYFMENLIALREKMPFPFIVGSAYRCSEHNQDVSTTGPDGPHTTGRAVDIRIQGTDARKLLDAAVRHRFEGIGIQQQGVRGRRFIHLDMMQRDAGPVIWSY